MIIKDDINQQGTSINVYRKFHNQSCGIFDALNDQSDDGSKLDKHDLQPEMYWEIDRSFVQFNEFDGWEEIAKKNLKTLSTFEMNSPDSFYNAILYSLTF